jgi:hypothetical protein
MLYFNKMPNLNKQIQLTDDFNSININELNTQPASKFLLRCMRDVPKINNTFTYRTLLNFMMENSKNVNYYTGSSTLKHNNIKNYWTYSKSSVHSARVPNFNNYYIFL